MEQANPTSKKRPFKIFEHSLSQFNDVVIPHRLDMMKKHRGNIEKAMLSGDYQIAIKEQSAAKMLVQNLRRDLSEIEALRNQVDVRDLTQFDKTIENSQRRALTALEEYISLGARLSPSKTEQMSRSSIDSEGVMFNSAPQLQILENKQSPLNKDEEEYVRSWERLQTDIEGLHSIYVGLHEMVETQGEVVDNIEDNVANATEAVSQGNIHLKQALKYKATMYPFLGAALGTLVGGPIGLVIGLKAGGCAAVGGGLLGFVGGRFLKKGQADKPSDNETHCIVQDSPSKPHQS